MKKKENKKMHIPRQEVIDNPIPTSLFLIKDPVNIVIFVPKLHHQYIHKQLHT